MLKRLIIAYGVMAVAGAVVLAGVGVGSPIVIYLFVNGLIVIAALLFERGRYRPPLTQGVPGKKPLNVSSIRAQVSS